MPGHWGQGHKHVPILRLPSHSLPGAGAGERCVLPAASQRHPAESSPSATMPPLGTRLCWSVTRKRTRALEGWGRGEQGRALRSALAANSLWF